MKLNYASKINLFEDKNKRFLTQTNSPIRGSINKYKGSRPLKLDKLQSNTIHFPEPYFDSEMSPKIDILYPKSRLPNINESWKNTIIIRNNPISNKSGDSPLPLSPGLSQSLNLKKGLRVSYNFSGVGLNKSLKKRDRDLK